MINWRKPIKLLWVFLFIIPFLTGCWDRVEIEERAVVLGIAIDTADEEAEKEEEDVSHLTGRFPPPGKGMIRLTAQIAVPGRIPLGPGEGGGGGGGGKGKETVWVLESVGHTVDDAVSNLQQKLSGPIFFGHLRIIIISEDIAKRGLRDMNDYFRRNPEVRRMTWMVVSKGSAGELMKAAPELERVPTLYLMSTLDQAVRMGKFPEDFVGIFWSHFSKKGQEGFLPYVELEPRGEVLIKGMAYFKGYKLAGVTKPLEIGFYMAIKGLNPAGYQVFVELPDQPGNIVVFNATQRKSKFKVSINGGRPHFKVNAYIEGNIREKSGEQFSIKEDTLKKIEQQINKEALKGLDILVKKTQEKGSDIFGFGEYVRAKEPAFWNKEIKTGERWSEMYKDVTVDINIKVKVRRVGMKAR
jgi:spore germination protein KC